MKFENTMRFTLVTALLIISAMASAATVDPLLLGLQADKSPDRNSVEPGLQYERIIATTNSDDGLTIGVIMYLNGSKPDFTSVAGLIPGSVSGNIATARLPLSSLNQLANVAGIDHIAASRIMWPTMDLAVPAGRVTEVWNGSPAYTGEGVLVGIIDSGIDWTHDDFKNGDGTTRIKAIWDLFGTGTPPAGFAYGAEYSEAQINAGSVDEEDLSGHGTHVSGIAAGNGNSHSGVYRGVAFESDILFAKPFDDSFNGFPEDKTIDAINYLVQKAESLDQPLSINMSLGGHSGPHDGTTAQEQVINNLSGEGVVFCIAAGNEGEASLHDSASANGGSMDFSIPAYAAIPGVNNDYAMISIWVDGATSPSVTISHAGATIGPVASGVADGASTASGVVVIDNASGGADPTNGDKQIFVQWDDRNGTDVASGDWTITLNGGAGTAHSWKLTSTMSTHFPDSDQLYSVGTPGTAEKAITVAAYKTRNSWLSQAGNVGYPPGTTWGDADIADIAPFSSIGPTRDDRQKPDLAAPGMAIVSCYSDQTTPIPQAVLMITGGDYFVTQGTSMASPFACGVVALMLEKNGDLTAEEVRTILRNSAYTDAYTGSVWNNVFGMGKIDAQAAVAAVAGPVDPAGGDIDGDGTATVLDVILLVNYILDPVTYPLSQESRAEADVYPPANGDGTLNVSDLARIVDFILDQDSPGKIRGEAQPVRLTMGRFERHDGVWWLPVTLDGNSMAAGQIAITVEGATWQPGSIVTDQENQFQVAARSSSSQLRVLVYDLDNELPGQGVTLHLPFETDNPGRPEINGVLVVDSDGHSSEISIVDIRNSFQPQLTVAPNPVITGTTVSFRTAPGEPFTLSVYDLRGRLIRTLKKGTGLADTGAVAWDGRDSAGRQLATGVYLMRLRSAHQQISRKIVLDH